MRISEQDLLIQIKRLNELTGNPTESYIKVKDKFKAQIGCYHLDSAYGGHALHQIDNASGCVRNISQIGYASKRDLYNWIIAYRNGVEVSHVNKK